MLRPVLIAFLLVWRWFVAWIVGLRPFEVRVVRRHWDSGRVNVGGYIDEKHVLSPRPRARHGDDGKIVISSISPKLGPFGSTPLQIQSPREPGVERFVEISGAFGEKQFCIASADFTNPLSYALDVYDRESSRPS